jgi:hypothetical protein
MYASNGTAAQNWVWDGTRFTNVLITGGGCVASGPYMADNNGATVTLNSTGDAWTTILVSGNTYKIRNNRTGLYLSVVSSAVAMSTAQTVWTISALAPPSPTAITLSPAKATIASNAPAGTLIATADVTMSDGSPFTGILTTSDTNFFAISGLNIVTARAVTSADGGAHSTVITASQATQSFSMGISI